MNPRSAPLAALGAAVLFGASTPFAKLLAGTVAPTLLAGLLYLGSGVGLGTLRLIRDRGFMVPPLRRMEWRWLMWAVLFGGVLGPSLLMYGLTRIAASQASLLLNLEAVLTSVLAWVVYREHASRRIVLAMVLIVVGGAVLAWPAQLTAPAATLIGPWCVCAACLCWAVDNNLTRKVSTSDALFIASIKGLVAGAVNVIAAVAMGAALPGVAVAAGAMVLGFAGYGASLVLFVVALRGLGTSRTVGYFSTAPFIGAVVAIALLHESTSAVFWIAAALMAAGVWLHLTEQHEHEHTHERLLHTHSHRHDIHHRHEHSFPWDAREPHVHEHEHEPLTHSHAHYPDVHHRHGH